MTSINATSVRNSTYPQSRQVEDALCCTYADMFGGHFAPEAPKPLISLNLRTSHLEQNTQDSLTRTIPKVEKYNPAKDQDQYGFVSNRKKPSTYSSTTVSPNLTHDVYLSKITNPTSNQKTQNEEDPTQALLESVHEEMFSVPEDKADQFNPVKDQSPSSYKEPKVCKENRRLRNETMNLSHHLYMETTLKPSPVIAPQLSNAPSTLPQKKAKGIFETIFGQTFKDFITNLVKLIWL